MANLEYVSTMQTLQERLVYVAKIMAVKLKMNV